MNTKQLMSREEVKQMLENLPANCVFDAIRGMAKIHVDFARQVLYNMEAEGVIEWKRETPPVISLTEKGNKFLEMLKNDKT